MRYFQRQTVAPPLPPHPTFPCVSLFLTARMASRGITLFPLHHSMAKQFWRILRDRGRETPFKCRTTSNGSHASRGRPPFKYSTHDSTTSNGSHASCGRPPSTHSTTSNGSHASRGRPPSTYSTTSNGSHVVGPRGSIPDSAIPYHSSFTSLQSRGQHRAAPLHALPAAVGPTRRSEQSARRHLVHRRYPVHHYRRCRCRCHRRRCCHRCTASSLPTA